MWEKYRCHGSILLGFHGCDKAVGEAILSGECALRSSSNDYDWLGPGVYFWENDPQRAFEFAKAAAGRRACITQGRISTPFVLGAIIDPGHCCDLQNSESTREVSKAHSFFAEVARENSIVMPKNVFGPDQSVRRLDCAVIRMMHQMREADRLAPYDTVRGAFWEGGALYPGAGFSSRQHVQIAVIATSSILGYFRPQD